MADDHVPEAEGSSNAPELASPQLSIPLSDKSSERQRTDELLERYEDTPVMLRLPNYRRG